MKRLLCTAVVLLSVMTFTASSRASEAVTLDEVLASVEAHYPVIRAATAEQAEASAGLLAAQGGFDPSVRASATFEPVSGYPKTYGQATVEVPTAVWGASLFGGYRIGRGTYPVYDQKLETNDSGEVRAGVRVPLLRDGPIDRRRAGIRTAEVGTGAARLGVAQQTIDARRVASSRYWDWVAAGARLEVVRAWLELARTRDQALADRVASGDVPEFERIENQRAIFQRETALVAAERDRRQAAVELSLFFRAADGTPRLPDDAARVTMPEPGEINITEAAAENAALVGRPEIRRLELQRERVRIERELAGNQRLPAVDVIVAGSKDFGAGEYKRGLPVLEVTAFVDVPVFNRAATGRADAADAALRRTEEQLRLARDRAIADVRIAAANVDTARRRAVATSRELGVARELAEGELRRFELGESNLLLVNLREQASAEASVRHVDVVADFHRGVASLRAAIGRNATRDRLE